MLVDGTEMVLLPVEQYQNLAASCRQVGAQAPQLRTLKLALHECDALLAEIEQALEDPRSTRRPMRPAA